MEIIAITSNQTIIDTLERDSVRYDVAAGVKLTYLVPVLHAVAEPRKRELYLSGEQAEADVVGVFLGHDDDKLTLHLDTTHAAPQTRGRTEFKAVLAGRSKLEFNGMIKIMPGAQNSNDFLQQDSLMLSDDAAANAIPGLEIEANDVKASHGATAKPVDPEQKFYLMSRGLTEAQAEGMIIAGFIAPMMGRLDPSWQSSIRQQLGQRFHLHHAFS